MQGYLFIERHSDEYSQYTQYKIGVLSYYSFSEPLAFSECLCFIQFDI